MKHRRAVTPAPDWLGLAAGCRAVIVCYGTLAALAGLSLLGVTLALDDGAWAGAIMLFALLALAGVPLGMAHHGRRAPTALAAAGTALIAWVLFVAYGLLPELAGFALLLGGAAWDWRLRRHPHRKVIEHD